MNDSQTCIVWPGGYGRNSSRTGLAIWLCWIRTVWEPAVRVQTKRSHQLFCQFSSYQVFADMNLKHLEKWLSLKPAKSFLDHPFFFLNIWSLEQTCWRKFFYWHLQNEWWSDFFPHVEIFSLTTRMEGMKFIFIFIVMLLTSRSNWESGASPASMPPPDDSELSDGDVMVCRLEL